MIPFIEILNRAHNGPYCTIRDWNIKVIAEKSRRIVEEHGLKGTYDPENLVNTDDGLADEFFEAGFEMALEAGMYCIDTERIIEYTEEEIKDALRESVPAITFGKRPDEVVVRTRRPEDKIPPIACLGPIGCPINEELWIPIHQSIAQYRVVDGMVPGSLETIYGIEIKAGTPLETMAGKYEAVMTKEALRRAGRPGMPLSGPETSPTEYGHFGGYGVPGGYEITDAPIILSVSELKTNYTLLHKVAHVIDLGALVSCGHRSMIGGFSGSPEGAAVVAVAAVILEILTYQAAKPSGSTFDVRYSCNTSRETIWADSISGQAQSKHVHRPCSGILSNLAGPCTEMIFYECTALGMALVTSGRSFLWGVRSAGGTQKNHSTGLESKLAAEVMKACAGMKRSGANEIVKEILPKYESKLKNPPKGKNFLECYDPVTLKPSKEWADIYHRVYRELRDLGVPLK
jgi:methylamine--corrinoid protein Co-methyltransferase